MPEEKGYPISNQVDGNNVSKFPDNAKFADIEKGHRKWTNSETGKRIDPPDYARDDD